MTALKEKLQELDKEIYTLHQFCVSKGFNPHQIEHNAQPLFSLVKEHKKKKYISIAFTLAIVIGVLAVLLNYEPVYKFMYAGMRISLIQLLPYWDWTQIYHQQCLLENPYYVGAQLEKDDCKLCEGLNKVPRLDNVSQALVTENYLKQDRPFIVTDAIETWDAMKKFNIQFLYQLYNSEESLKTQPSCMFLTNIRLPSDSAIAILRKAASGDIDNYFAHWENCGKMSAKTLRQFYKRPYFIPAMVEMAEPNWIFISHSYTGKKSKPADIAFPMMWIAVLKGKMKIILLPRKPCKEICPTLYATVHSGEILVATDLLWLVDYIPHHDGEMVALGGGGYFD